MHAFGILRKSGAVGNRTERTKFLVGRLLATHRPNLNRILFLACITLVLEGCVGKTSREQMFDELKAQREVDTPFPTAGITYSSFDNGHGYQVEYLSADGRAYLWYPGNHKPVVGAWKRVLDEVCYRYGKNTYNPQTFQRGGTWHCEYSGRLEFHVTAYQRGDIFNLKSGRIPYFRDRCDQPKGLRRVKKVSCK